MPVVPCLWYILQMMENYTLAIQCYLLSPEHVQSIINTHTHTVNNNYEASSLSIKEHVHVQNEISTIGI